MKKNNPDSTSKFAILFKNKEKADVWFTTGDTKIPAHKFLLAASSDVFERMFYGHGQFDPVDEIPIIEPIASFTEFLQLFYLDKVNVTEENIENVAILVDKYHVKNCMQLCEEFMKDLVTSKTVCSYLDTALMVKMSTKTIQHLESMLSKKTKEVLNTDGFKECSRDTLEKILSLNEIDCDEVAIFEGVMEWASFECKRHGLDDDIFNKKRVLGECFYLIRFPVMKIRQFLDCIEPYPTIMQLDECVDILQYISSKRPMTIAAKFVTQLREKSVIEGQVPSVSYSNNLFFGNNIFPSINGGSNVSSTARQFSFASPTFGPTSGLVFGSRSGIP